MYTSRKKKNRRFEKEADQPRMQEEVLKEYNRQKK